MSIYDYWRMYDITLARVRDEKPDTFQSLKAILDRFTPPSSGDAFFPGGADDDLADALIDAGWNLDFTEGDYLYTATHPVTHAKLQHVEGDLYDETANRPGARIYLVHTADPQTRLQPRDTGTVISTDDAGTVHVAWDNGSTLGLIPGVDAWRPLHPRWDSQPMVQTLPPISQRRGAVQRCPECRDGKCNNCTGWALDAEDNMTDCPCSHAATSPTLCTRCGAPLVPGCCDTTEETNR